MGFKGILVGSVVVAGLLVFFGSNVRAEDSTARAVRLNDTAEIRAVGSPKPALFMGLFRNSDTSENPEPKESPKPFTFKIDRLKDVRLKFCEVHHDEIANRSQSLGKLVSEMLGKFDGIATRVEDYYSSKVVSNGKVVANYDALVADIAAKRALVIKDLTSAENDVAGFSCTGDNPKGQITQYRTDMQLVKKDLQAYRTSIKNLIVAIRSVVGEGEKESPKPSASPI